MPVSSQLTFVSPSQSQLSGLVDLRVNAPADTTAVRFFLDEIQLSELTNTYAVETKTAPLWLTATDAGWFGPGAHTLRAEADTPAGLLQAQLPVTTSAPAPPPGVTSLTGGWHLATASELPTGALVGDTPPAAQPGY